jgi:hypothetical protein
VWTEGRRGHTHDTTRTEVKQGNLLEVVNRRLLHFRFEMKKPALYNLQ